MAVTKLSNSGIATGGVLKYDSMLAGNPAYIPTAYDSIATVVVGAGGVAEANFTNIPSGFAHLQLRIITRGETTLARTAIQFNGNTSAIYDNHGFFSTGVTVGSYGDLNQVAIEVSNTPTSSDPANVFACAFVDILDYASTNKNKVVRATSGWRGTSSGYVDTRTGSWRSTDAITSIKVRIGFVGSGDFNQYSKFALYGIRGA